MIYKNILLCVFFFYVTFDLLTALFMYRNHPKANREYYRELFSMTGMICFMIAIIMTILLFNNLICLDKVSEMIK